MAVLDRVLWRLYRRLGRHYSLLFPIAQDPASIGIATIAVLLLTAYYDPTSGELWLMLAAGWASSLVAIWYAFWRSRPYHARVVRWIDTDDPTSEETVAAWDAATNLPMRSFRANAGIVAAVAAVPAIAVIAATLNLDWGGVLVLIAATLPAVAYAIVLNYFTAELLMRPVIQDIAAQLPEKFPFAANGLLIRKRLKILLPVFTTFVALIVAGLVTGHHGTGGLALSVAVSFGVALILSYELPVLLSRSVTAPIAELRRGLAMVRGGEYDARVPVVTSDELGELSHEFNELALGLAEREQMREAFGTYLDRDIVPLILSGRFPREGIEVTVSIMFVDVRGFTSFAERADATEVVASLNPLFEVIVPIIPRHGGHVDKFIGDGLLASFGAPEGYTDHADRAVAAGIDIVRAVNTPDTELAVAVGINTGRVVAGSIGGAGRLNFSIIGDPVNTAARVEAATRDTGDDLLITRTTCEDLERPLPLVSRGTVPLKGKADPVEVFAYVPVEETEAEPAAARYSSRSSRL